MAAEDKTFFSHGGIDAGGLAGAVIDYISKLGSDQRAVGGSTITQQVAKNILLTNEYSVTRKLKEMMLARRIEGVLSKQQILELYLNEIPLGRRSFGVQAASRAYFDKDVGDLELHQVAFLAILPKAPEVYGRAQNAETALSRRNFVLGQMAENEFITLAEANAAKALPLGLVNQRSSTNSVDAGYFLEEVRRELIAKFGETAEDEINGGKNSVYGGGVWVRTSLDPEMQEAARNSLRRGMMRYHGSNALIWAEDWKSWKLREKNAIANANRNNGWPSARYPTCAFHNIELIRNSAIIEANMMMIAASQYRSSRFAKKCQASRSNVVPMKNKPTLSNVFSI